MNNLEDGRNKIWKKGREERINSRYKTRARGTYNQRLIIVPRKYVILRRYICILAR